MVGNGVVGSGVVVGWLVVGCLCDELLVVALAKALLADELTGELDSATADQLLTLLEHLNAQRQLTLIVVTHNPAIAARARRQVRIVDGQLFESEVSYA